MHRRTLGIRDPARAGLTVALVALCRLEDLDAGPLLVDVPDTDDTVLVLRAVGEVHVLDGHCPHQFAPLLGGEIAGCILTCPLHGWRFDVRTGISPDSTFLRVRHWPSRVEAGVVWLETSTPPA